MVVQKHLITTHKPRPLSYPMIHERPNWERNNASDQPSYSTAWQERTHYTSRATRKGKSLFTGRPKGEVPLFWLVFHLQRHSMLVVYQMLKNIFLSSDIIETLLLVQCYHPSCHAYAPCKYQVWVYEKYNHIFQNTCLRKVTCSGIVKKLYFNRGVSRRFNRCWSVSVL